MYTQSGFLTSPRTPHLDGVLFAYCTSVHKSTGFTPYELMFDRSLTVAMYGQLCLIMNTILHFRKAILPTEAEINNNSTDSFNVIVHQYEDQYANSEEIWAQMKKINNAIDFKVMMNIKYAQEHYKKEYDIKHHVNNVSV